MAEHPCRRADPYAEPPRVPRPVSKVQGGPVQAQAQAPVRRPIALSRPPSRDAKGSGHSIRLTVPVGVGCSPCLRRTCSTSSRSARTELSGAVLMQRESIDRPTDGSRSDAAGPGRACWIALLRGLGLGLARSGRELHLAGSGGLHGARLVLASHPPGERPVDTSFGYIQVVSSASYGLWGNPRLSLHIVHDGFRTGGRVGPCEHGPRTTEHFMSVWCMHAIKWARI